MRARDIGGVLLKVWGVTLLVKGTLTLISLVPMAFSPSNPDVRFALMSNALNAIVAMAAGVAVFVGAEAILRMIGIADGSPSEEGPSRYSIAELQSLVFGGLGIYFLIGALSDIAILVYTILRKPAWDSTDSLTYLFFQSQSELVGAVVQLIAAILLLVNRTMLASAWHRMRPMTSRRDAE